MIMVTLTVVALICGFLLLMGGFTSQQPTRSVNHLMLSTGILALVWSALSVTTFCLRHTFLDPAFVRLLHDTKVAIAGAGIFSAIQLSIKVRWSPEAKEARS